MTTALATRPKLTFFNSTNLLDDTHEAPQLPTLRRKVDPMEIGLFPQGLTDAEKSVIKAQIVSELEALGIEPLEPKSIELFGWMSRDPSDTEAFHQRGRVVPHDEVEVFMARRPIAAFVSDGNSIPEKARRIVAGLQRAGMPLVWSLTVWVPQSATPIPDPMLVLELPTGDCIGLCYWIA